MIIASHDIYFTRPIVTIYQLAYSIISYGSHFPKKKKEPKKIAFSKLCHKATINFPTVYHAIVVHTYQYHMAPVFVLLMTRQYPDCDV